MKNLIYALIFLLWPTLVFGGTYTIDNTDGETINGGTICSGACSGGDIIIISKDRTDPIYFSNITGTGVTEGNYITIKNDSTGKVTITGNTSSWANSIVFIDCQYFKLLGNNYGSETYGIELTSGNGLRLLRSSDYEIAYIKFNGTSFGVYQNNNIDWVESDGPITNVNVHHNYMVNLSENGLYFGITSGSDVPHFQDIQLHDNIMNGTSRSCMTLRRFTGTNNNVYGNTLSNCAIGAVDNRYAISMYLDISEGEIYQNYIDTTDHNAIDVASTVGGAIDVHDNIILNAGNHGVHFGSDHNHNINHNTIVASTGAGIAEDSSGTVTCKYNLIVGSGSLAIDSDGAGTLTTSDNRCEAGGLEGGNCDNTSSGEAGEYFDASYNLTYQSPAINQGSGAIVESTDFNGNTRPYGSTDPDIGAYEFTFKAASVSPADDATGVAFDADLTWQNPTTTTGVNLYFDKATTPPTTKVVDNSNVETYEPGTLDSNSTYYFRIDLVHADGTETGDEYSFTTTTQENPPTPTGSVQYLKK